MNPSVARLVRRLAARESARDTATVQRELIANITRTTHGGVAGHRDHPHQAGDVDDYAIHIHGGAFVLGHALDLTAMLMADALHMPVLSIQ